MPTGLGSKPLAGSANWAAARPVRGSRHSELSVGCPAWWEVSFESLCAAAPEGHCWNRGLPLAPGRPPGGPGDRTMGCVPSPHLPSGAWSPRVRRQGDKVMFVSDSDSERGGALGPLPVFAPLPSGSALASREEGQQGASRFCFCGEPGPPASLAGAWGKAGALGGQDSQLDGPLCWLPGVGL